MNATAILDLFLLALIVLSIVAGYWYGFLKPLFGMIAIFAGGFAAYWFAGPASDAVYWIEAEHNRRAFAFGVIFLVVMIVVNLFFRWLRIKADLGWADKQLGWSVGLLRFCFAATFIITPLQFNAFCRPIFEKSLVIPVITFGGLAANLLLPSPIDFPGASSAGQVEALRDMELAITFRMQSAEKTHCDVRVRGNSEIEKYFQLEWLLPTGPQWTISKRQVGPERWEHQATAEITSLSNSNWGLFTADWVEESSFLRKRGRLKQTISLPSLSSRKAGGDIPIAAPAADRTDDRIASLLAGWEKLLNELNKRAADQAMQSVAVPVRVQWDLPLSAESGSGPGYQMLGKSVAWNFSLAPGDRVELSAHAVGTNWGQWFLRMAVVLVLLGVIYRFLRARWTSPDEGTADLALPTVDSSDEGAFQF